MRQLLCLFFLFFSMQLNALAKSDDLNRNNMITIDTHGDTTQRFVWDNFDLGHQDDKGSIDIPRMRAGNLNGIFFSIWMPGTITGKSAVQQALTQIDAVRNQVKKHQKDLSLCTTAEQIENAYRHNKIAVLMGVEGGHMINNDLNNLRQFFNLGVRYMTLTHSVNTDWADSSTAKPQHNGLTNFGKKVIQEMNNLGMIVDISHVSDKTFYDALATSKAPMMASHSSCRAICDAPRNMSDDMIKALAEKGGVIQINYNNSFLSQPYRDAVNSSSEMKQLEEIVKSECGDNEACNLMRGDETSRRLVSRGKLPKVSWKMIIKHIDHVVKLVGVDHVGLGSDFDGANMPYGMEDATHLPQITKALLAEGYSQEEVSKILGGNTLRVMREAERVAHEMQRKA